MHRNRLFILIFVGALTFCSALSVSHASLTNRIVKAEHLVALMGFEQQLALKEERFKEIQQEWLGQMEMNENVSKELDSTFAIAIRAAFEAVDWDSIHMALVMEIAQSYSEADMDELTTFFSTDLGQRFLNGHPLLMRHVDNQIFTHMRENMPAVDELASTIASAKAAEATDNVIKRLFRFGGDSSDD